MHRDVHTGNVLYAGGEFLLGDFGKGRQSDTGAGGFTLEAGRYDVLPREAKMDAGQTATWSQTEIPSPLSYTPIPLYGCRLLLPSAPTYSAKNPQKTLVSVNKHLSLIASLRSALFARSAPLSPVSVLQPPDPLHGLRRELAPRSVSPRSS
jgi:hypothetical protein